MERKYVRNMYVNIATIYIYIVSSLIDYSISLLSIFLPEDKNKFIVDWAFHYLMKSPSK